MRKLPVAVVCRGSDVTSVSRARQTIRAVLMRNRLVSTVIISSKTLFAQQHHPNDISDLFVKNIPNYYAGLTAICNKSLPLKSSLNSLVYV